MKTACTGTRIIFMMPVFRDIGGNIKKLIDTSSYYFSTELRYCKKYDRPVVKESKALRSRSPAGCLNLTLN